MSADINSSRVTQVQASQFNANVYAASYVSACISEALDPGSFQEVMEDFARKNNMPIIKYPTPRLGVLKALAPDSLAVNGLRQNGLRHRLHPLSKHQTQMLMS